ncbi:MAG: sulfatase-like hydrolase/transferase [Mariniblastus sp.]|nr:sulfatase-like hydrolase/transferase [Mariniblastus sp.]
MNPSKLLTLTCFLLICAVIPKFSIAEERPNFLWIMSEDNSKHYLKMFDDAGAETPNIQKLADHGLTFRRAFSNAPVCSVARTTLITSVYAPRLGTQFHRRIKVATMPNDWKMFPAYLRAAGYYTTNHTKKDYNANETDDVWDNSSPKAHWQNRPAGSSFFHVQTYADSHESSLHFRQTWVDNPDNITDPSTIQLAPYHPDTPLFRLTYARYHDRIKTIDQKVGKLIEQLTEEGQLENTFVVYFGDHGGVLPRGKGYANESGLHVPLVIRVPEKWKHLTPFDLGSSTNGFVEFVDFGPTMLKLAGVDVPTHMDGTPFLGKGVSANDIDARDETLGYADRMDEKYDLVRTLRRGKWKYIRNYQAIYPDGHQNNYRYINLAWSQWRELSKAGKLNETQNAFFKAKPAEQLFDISIDPHETKNLAAQPEHRTKLLEMRSSLVRRLKDMPDLSFFPESHLVQEALDTPIAFGQEHKAQIARLIDTADLALEPVESVATKISAALASNDRFERYWALMTCSVHGENARQFAATAKQLVANDEDLLVRLRAAEFLGQIKEMDPVPTIRQIVANSNSSTVNLIALQTLVHFKDGDFDYDTSIDTSTVKHFDEQVFRRIGYLDGLSQSQIKKRMREIAQKRKKKRKSKQ